MKFYKIKFKTSASLLLILHAIIQITNGNHKIKVNLGKSVLVMIEIKILILL